MASCVLVYSGGGHQAISVRFSSIILTLHEFLFARFIFSVRVQMFCESISFASCFYFWRYSVIVEIYTPTYVSPNMHMTCLLLAQDTQVKIVCVSDLLVIIVQSGSGALAPVTGFLGK